MSPVVIDQGLPRDSVTGALAVSGGGGSVDTSTLVIKGPAASTDNAIQPTGAAVIPLVLKGAASQSADLSQWQNSAGTVLAKITAGGEIRTDAGVKPISGGGYVFTMGGSPNNWFFPGHTSHVPLMVQGQGGQTGNLTEWQNGVGAVLAAVTASGSVQATATSSVFPALKGATAGNVVLSLDNSLSALQVESVGTAKPALVVKGLASQTGNLQEWQNSAGSALARVDKDGNGVFLGVSAGTNNFIGGLLWNNVGALELYGASGGAASIKPRTAVTINPSGEVATTTVPLTVKGTAAHTANMQEWQNSAGTAGAYVGWSGSAMVMAAPMFLAGGGQVVVGTNNSLPKMTIGQGSYQLNIQNKAAQTGTAGDPGWEFAWNGSGAAGMVTMRLKQGPSQTADLLQITDSSDAILGGWQVDGTLRIDAAGKGLKLKSPNGSVTRTLTIDNTGALVVS